MWADIRFPIQVPAELRQMDKQLFPISKLGPQHSKINLPTWLSRGEDWILLLTKGPMGQFMQKARARQPAECPLYRRTRCSNYMRWNMHECLVKQPSVTIPTLPFKHRDAWVYWVFKMELFGQRRTHRRVTSSEDLSLGPEIPGPWNFPLQWVMSFISWEEGADSQPQISVSKVSEIWKPD